MTARTDEITERFTEWLDRYSPPRHFAKDAKAMQAEADALLKTIIRNAPSTGYTAWIGEMLERLSGEMKTRAWPTVGEMTQACRAKAVTRSTGNDDAVEDNCLRIMAEWFEKFKAEMPSMGRADRTRKLIDQGVIENERAAKFYGFNLSDNDAAKAAEQKMTRPEWDHHCRVTASLRGCTIQEAADAERRRINQQEPPEPPAGAPFKRMPIPA